MKRLFCLLIIAVMLITMLAGCKDTDTSETTTSAASENTTAEITSASDETTLSDLLTTEGVSEEVTTAAEETTLKSEETTKPSEPSSSVASEETTAAGEGISVSVPADNEYNILRSGTFYVTGTMIENTGVDSPLEMAVTPNSVYMMSEFEGLDMGMLIYDEKLYMIYPEKKAYMEMDDSIMNMAGLSIEELMGEGNIDFSSFGRLEDAFNVTEEKVKGVNCTVYHIMDDDGMLRVYMSGSKIMRFASYTAEGKFITATEIDSISPSVPAGMDAPPEDYKCYKGVVGMMSFMAFFTDIL